MIVAGSVLALLLMGLAVDGFVNPVDEDPDDHASESGAEEDQPALGDDANNGLEQMLFPDAADEDAAPEAFTYGPLDTAEDEDTSEDAAEARADDAWNIAQASLMGQDLVDVEATTSIEGAEDVPYVEAFDPATDVLVLEFDGASVDAPVIEIDHESEDEAALVLANGLPVTLVEGASDMTADHVRVVMRDDEDADPVPNRADAASGPQILTLPPEFGDPLLDTDADLRHDEGAPQVRPVPPELEATPQLDLGDSDLVDPTAIDTPVVGPVDLPDPVDLLEDVVETIEDGIPAADILDATLDQISDDLSDIGGMDEMLDARVAIGDAFGTGGTDALTGTFNNDMVQGTDGQDALFGDEGDDTLTAGAGNDEVHADIGNDVLHGEAGIDFLDGGEGNDTLDGGGDRDLLFGGDGDDVLYGGAAADFLQGGMGADMLNGGSGNDVLDGTFGTGTADSDDADTLWGGDGDDTIILGQGDSAHGGAGADTFTSGSYLEDAAIAGHVNDFNPGEDRIEVIFDPEQNPDPLVEVEDFADGTGANILLNGEVILSVSGAQGLDPNLIDLREMA